MLGEELVALVRLGGLEDGPFGSYTVGEVGLDGARDVGNYGREGVGGVGGSAVTPLNVKARD